MRVARRGFCAGFGVALALAGAALPSARAAGRAPSDYFKLDLPDAVMSPEPLGPPAHFERFGIEANSGTNWLPAPPQQTAAAPAAAAPAAPAPNAAAPAAPNPATANAVPAPHRHVAQRRASPYEARAAMAKPKPRTPITRWPCKSGGICAWQSPPVR